MRAGPYINNLNVILRKNGIELQNQNLKQYEQTGNMSVNDDIIAQVDYRLSKYKEDTNKINENDLDQKRRTIERKFKHDCILWHAVNDKRPDYIDSVKDIKNWILTLDFQFLSYDRYKCNILGKRISLCLHPNDLISLLYFWVPRSEKFEKAVLENFRLPFSFKEFDEKTEQVSLAILSALSYYENSADIDKGTVTELLTNQALRNKIKPDSSIEKNAAIIKDEIFEKYQQKQKELEEKDNETSELKKELLQVINKQILSLEKTIYDFIEKQLDKDRLSAVSSAEKDKAYISERITEKEKRLEELNQLKANFENELGKETNKFLNLFVNREKLRKKILRKYPTIEQIGQIESEIKELKEEMSFLQFELATSLVFFCENKNAKYYNELDLNNIKFIGENNGSGVFIKIVSNPTYFGIRDRDFLTDEEIIRLKQKFPNYRILEYYCFENYLYHPDNINSLNIDDFNKDEYIKYIKLQSSTKRDDIILKLKSSRKTYQEFKTTETGIKPEKNAEQTIIEYLDSEEIEFNLKAFSLKDFNKEYLNEYNLKQSVLTKTEWFINKIKKVLE